MQTREKGRGGPEGKGYRRRTDLKRWGSVGVLERCELVCEVSEGKTR